MLFSILTVVIQARKERQLLKTTKNIYRNLALRINDTNSPAHMKIKNEPDVVHLDSSEEL